MVKYPETYYYLEQLLLGKRKRIKAEVLSGSPSEKEEKALDFIRLAIEDLGENSPEVAYDTMTEADFRMIPKLGFILDENVIRLDPTRYTKSDFYAIIAKAYPGRFQNDEMKERLRTYKRYLSREVKSLDTSFFLGDKGKVTACMCLEWAISNAGEFSMESPESLFRFFTMKKSETFLKKYKLLDYSKAMYEFNIDFLFDTYSEGARKDPVVYSQYVRYRKKLEQKKEKELAKKEAAVAKAKGSK